MVDTVNGCMVAGDVGVRAANNNIDNTAIMVSASTTAPTTIDTDIADAVMDSIAANARELVRKGVDGTR